MLTAASLVSDRAFDSVVLGEPACSQFQEECELAGGGPQEGEVGDVLEQLGASTPAVP
jgi:hypothetical protein